MVTLMTNTKPHDGEKRILYRHPETNKPACGAKTNHPNKYGEHRCLVAPMPNGRCHKHGGATPKGLALPQTKHGRYSKYLPANLLGQYNEAISDPELLTLNDEIAALQARAMQLMERLTDGDTYQLWQDLRNAQDELETARSNGDAQQMAFWMNETTKLIKKGASEAGRWRELRETFIDMERLKKTEIARRKIAQDSITAQEGMLLVMNLVNIIREEVTDRETFRRVATRIQGLITLPRPASDDGG